MNKVIVEIGSFIGDTPIYFSLKGARKIFAYEPLPEAYNLLIKNMKVNKLNRKVIGYNLAVDSEAKIKKFSFRTKWTILLLFLKRKKANTVKLSASHQKKILKNINQKEIILKLNCEGCEYNLLYNTKLFFFRKISTIIAHLHGDKKLMKNLSLI